VQKVTNRDQIITSALVILKAAPKGMRYTQLVDRIQEALPQIPKNTIHGTVWNLDAKLPAKVLKPSKGLFLHADFREPFTDGDVLPTPPAVEKIKEEKFYKPFADWLVNDLEECTRAIPVGGNAFKDKWGTPDVVGVREPKKSDIIKFATEIVAAEVKLDPAGLITAFGQVCAYRLFSHKAYLVIPAEAPADDIARLDTLSRIFDIGLILFNSKQPDDPQFDIRVRAAKHEPDMFYVNRCMKVIEDDLFD
jgi:hypothetical protein